MEQTQDLKRRLGSAQDLHSVTRTMKSLAAVNIRHYQQAAAALDDYFRTVIIGLRILLRGRTLPETGEAEASGTGIIVVGSEQGMAGRFNERIAAYAADRVRETGADPASSRVLAVGSRAAPHLYDAGLQPDEQIGILGSGADIRPTVQEALLWIDRQQTRRRIGRILLFFNRTASGASFEPAMQQVLPLDRAWIEHLEREEWPTRMLPTYLLPWDRLFAALIREYFFVSLHRALVQSLAGENASRLATMQAAERNIADRIEELESSLNRLRQNAITVELLDIITGFEALRR